MCLGDCQREVKKHNKTRSGTGGLAGSFFSKTKMEMPAAEGRGRDLFAISMCFWTLKQCWTGSINFCTDIPNIEGKIASASVEQKLVNPSLQFVPGTSFFFEEASLISGWPHFLDRALNWAFTFQRCAKIQNSALPRLNLGWAKSLTDTALFWFEAWNSGVTFNNTSAKTLHWETELPRKYLSAPWQTTQN